MRVLALLAVTLLVPSGFSAADSFDRGTGFELAVTAPATSRPATTVDLAVSVKATQGRKLNEDYPFKIDVAAPADVRVSRSKLDRSDATSFSASGAEFRIAVTPASAGDKVLRLDVRFAMCTDVNCEPYRRTIEVPLRVR